MKNLNVKNIIVAILGVLFLGVGIGMFAKVGIGVDSVTSLYTALVRITGLSLGTITALANVTMIVVALILDKKNVGLASIAFILLSKWPVDLANKYMICSDSLFISIILCIISIFIIALGSELFVLSNLGASGYDAMILGICKAFKGKFKYVYVRYAFDGLLLVIDIFLGGDIGLGTIICLVLVGNFIKLCQNILVKYFHLQPNNNI